MKKDIIWNDNGWTVVQDADAEKHILEISVRSEVGTVVEIRTRHNDGEVTVGSATVDGKNALPMALDEFKKLLKKGEIEIR